MPKQPELEWPTAKMHKIPNRYAQQVEAEMRFQADKKQPEPEKLKELKKREWCYVMNPSSYEIACDLCGGSNIEWSEYEHMIWCYDCKKDTRGNGGIFDGPIPIMAAKMFGLSFNRIEIPSGKILYERIVDDRIEYGYDKPKESETGNAQQ
jgi:hypothetical protein